MKNTKKLIPLKELNLTNRFLFDEVMEDAQTHKDVLEIGLVTESIAIHLNQNVRKCQNLFLRMGQQEFFSIPKGKIGYNVTEIAEILEENIEEIQKIYNVAVKYEPDYNIDKIMEELER